MKILIEKEFAPEKLIVVAGVRYWEDATVNGEPDTEGTKIPMRVGDSWNPIIDISTGKVIDWPEGLTADIHYKVCDAGEYWLEDAAGLRVKRKDYYVPCILCPVKSGYGDYIIMSIDGNGMINGWNSGDIDDEEWEVES